MAADTVRALQRKLRALPLLISTFEIQTALYEVFVHLGPGFVHRIYANALLPRTDRLQGLDRSPGARLDVSLYKGQLQSAPSRLLTSR